MVLPPKEAAAEHASPQFWPVHLLLAAANLVVRMNTKGRVCDDVQQEGEGARQGPYIRLPIALPDHSMGRHLEG